MMRIQEKLNKIKQDFSPLCPSILKELEELERIIRKEVSREYIQGYDDGTNDPHVDWG